MPSCAGGSLWTSSAPLLRTEPRVQKGDSRRCSGLRAGRMAFMALADHSGGRRARPLHVRGERRQSHKALSLECLLSFESEGERGGAFLGKFPELPDAPGHAPSSPRILFHPTLPL